MCGWMIVCLFVSVLWLIGSPVARLSPDVGSNVDLPKVNWVQLMDGMDEWIQIICVCGWEQDSNSHSLTHRPLRPCRSSHRTGLREISGLNFFLYLKVTTCTTRVYFTGRYKFTCTNSLHCRIEHGSNNMSGRPHKRGGKLTRPHKVAPPDTQYKRKPSQIKERIFKQAYKHFERYSTLTLF